MSITALLKLPLKIKVILAAFLLSIILCFFQGQVFTGSTLTESLVLSTSVLYLFGRYRISAIITRYQQLGYQPVKSKRRMDDLFVNTFAKVILPICLNMVLACSILLLIKYFHFFNFQFLGKLLSSIMAFNKEYLKYPLLIACGIVGFLTLVNVLSEDFYKKYKKQIKKFTSPIKVIAILVLFLNADKGIETDHILFAIHQEPVKAEQLSFEPTQEQKDKAEQAARKFVAEILEEADEQPQQSQQVSIHVPESFFDAKITDTRDFLKSHTEYHGNYDFSEGGTYNAQEQSDLNNTFAKAYESSEPEVQRPVEQTNLYRKVKEQPVSFFDELIANLANEKQTTSESSEPFIKSMMKDYFGDLVGGYIKSGVSEMALPGLANYSIFKEASVEVIKDQLKDAFLYVISQKNISKEEIRAVVKSVSKHLGAPIKQMYAFVEQRVSLLQKYMADIQDRVINTSDRAFEAANPTNDITYEDGLKLKQEMNKDELSAKSLREVESYYTQLAAEKRPDLTVEERQTLVGKVLDDYKATINQDIENLDGILTQKQYKDFDFLKNKWSSGGIMFGLGIDSTLAEAQQVSGSYFPVINNLSPSNFASSPSALWVRKDKGKFKLYITSSKGILLLNNSIDSALLATAYRFVYEKDTYPSIIDMFYDYRKNPKKPLKVPAYHKAIVHNSAMKNLFGTADQFIFNVLDKKINSPVLERELSSARASYGRSSDLYSSNRPSLSRLFDESHILTTSSNHTFSIHTAIKFSVVHTMAKKDQGEGSIYQEMEEISTPFNEHKQELITSYAYLQKIHEFAGYQALFRAVSQSNTNVIQLFTQVR